MRNAPTTTTLSPDEITELRIRQAEDHAYLKTLLEEIGYIKEDLQTAMSDADYDYYKQALLTCRAQVADLQLKMLVRLKHI